MKIQINADSNIENSEDFSSKVSSKVEDGLSQFKTWISRVEVHLGDGNGKKSGHKMGHLDKRYMIEVRPRGHRPTSVTNHADHIDQAIHGAIDKMKIHLSTLSGKLNEHQSS